MPLFQAAAANLNPFTEAKIDTKNPERGPLLIISGEKDHTVPWSIAHASFKRQDRNPQLTGVKEVPDRGHSLTIDHGWRDVATQPWSSSSEPAETWQDFPKPDRLAVFGGPRAFW